MPPVQAGIELSPLPAFSAPNGVRDRPSLEASDSGTAERATDSVRTRTRAGKFFMGLCALNTRCLWQDRRLSPDRRAEHIKPLRSYASQRSGDKRRPCHESRVTLG